MHEFCVYASDLDRWEITIEPAAACKTPSDVCFTATRCVAFTRVVISRATTVWAEAGQVRTGWTWGWSIRKGSGSGGRSRENCRAKWLLVAVAREEHAELLGSVSLNGAGDDPVDEYVQTGNSETTTNSSSSESEQEDVHCLMANQSTDDEVFDFSNSEFTREDLINALNEMVHEYRKLYQTFEEIKAENGCLKNSSVESRTSQLEDTDCLQTELSKLKIENDLLRTKSYELSSENERLSQVMCSWTKSSVS
ncbi:hypothetical protein F511_42550 [Dorcoceras hygrometricum]|uniref:Uncharacterized protein n=1 Tax=Dorcoceras hygrometricum TaxID=472368 RepID=A0A2Z7C8A0_9LAMI|nr:hypothetical protein F511_42550 [Dorcoceras hygrometricum]